MTPRRAQRLRDILAHRQPDLTVLMDNVHKPHNVSAVMRTCDAVGVGEIHAVSPQRGFRARHHSAAGSRRYVRIRTHPDHPTAFASLRERGMRVVAAHLTPEAIDFRDIDYTAPTAILLGSELDGPSDQALAGIDDAITIPMHGAVASLNVSVAAAVILYEAQRQRAAAGLYDTPRLDQEKRERLLFEWGYPRLATLCIKRGVAYPTIDEDGRVVGEVPRG